MAARIGVPAATIQDAQKHVAAATKYPELAAPGIPQKDAIEIAKNLDALPEEERAEARSRMIAGDSNVKATLAGKPPLPPPLQRRDKTPADRWRATLEDPPRGVQEIFFELKWVLGFTECCCDPSPR